MSRGRRRRILCVFGTRPEAIKLAPLILAMRDAGDLDPVVAVTGQHRSMLDQVLATFAITPDHDLDIGRSGQGLTAITCGSLLGLEDLLATVAPDALVVQGDTTSAFAAALAGFYAGVPVAHVEAGLRTGDLTAPFPEEANRRLITRVAGLHLAPTPAAVANLVAEGVPAEQVLCTGNTVVDALAWTVAHGGGRRPEGMPDPAGRRVVLVTVHRRESWGGAIAGVGRAVAAVARSHPDVLVVVPVHKNPIVRTALGPELTGIANVAVIEPLPYHDLAWVLARSHLVVTDSGGLQEEAPGLGVPVLVLRDVTERAEAVAVGAAELIGTEAGYVAARVGALLGDDAAHARMAGAGNPFGDGRAAGRCIDALRWWLGTGTGPRPAGFEPGAPAGVPVREPAPAG